MSSIHSEYGIKKKVTGNTQEHVELLVNGSLYKDSFMKVGQTAKNVMLAILKYMDNDMNTIQIGGDTLKAIVEHTGYSEQTIRDNLRVLYPLLEKTKVIRGEYIVNPSFAIKGSKDKVWANYTNIEVGIRAL